MPYWQLFSETTLSDGLASHLSGLFASDMICLSTCFCALLLAGLSSSAPAGPSGAIISSGVAASASIISAAGTRASNVPPAAETAPTIKLDPNSQLWNESSKDKPEPIRGSLGAPIIGPTSDVPIDKQNADFLAPPTTDHGSM